VNRVKKVGSFATVAYTVDDKMQTITFGSGEVATYTYDNRERPTRILDKIGVTKNLDLNYTYDGTGNVLTLNTESYGYDWLDRLTSSTGPWTTITYAYDQVGNRVKMVQGSTTTYTYGSFNRLSSAGSTTYTYDANGNVITKNDGFSWTFTYDYDNRLTKVVRAGSTVLQSVYDGDGKRIKKTEGNPIVFTYQGLNVLYEKDLTSGVVTKRFYANGLQVAKMVGSTTTYLHEDHIGSIRFVSSSTGSQVFSSNYVPYGPQYGASGTPDEFLYAGKIYDGSTGLYYFGARYYDPTTGRFVTEDSHRGSLQDPKSLNLYVYCGDNPLKFTDPNGNDWWNPFTWTPAQQTAAVIVVGAALGSVLCAVCAPALIGAAVSATTYTFTAGSSATPSGVLAFAAVGALGGGLGTVVSASAPIFTTTASGGLGFATGGTLGSFGPIAGAVGQVVSGIAASIAGQLVDHALLGHPVAPAQQVIIQGGVSGGVGGIAGDYFGVPVVHALRGAVVGAAASGGVDLIPNLISNGPDLQANHYYPGGAHAE